MKTFKNETYRSIEIHSQQYCSKFNIYKLYSDQYVNCGWFSCLSFFQFLHITHGGKLLPKSYNNLDDALKFEYIDILNNFKNTNRSFSDRKLSEKI
jgi:hypothetical protein